jgi:hypothetical protein
MIHMDSAWDPGAIFQAHQALTFPKSFWSRASISRAAAWESASAEVDDRHSSI